MKKIFIFVVFFIIYAVVINNMATSSSNRNGTPPGNSTSLLLRCLDYAAKMHSGQTRKDGRRTPYINHPIGVASLIANEGGCPDNITVLCVPVLHDIVEDTEGSFAEITQQFGKEIASLVAEVTDDKQLPRNVRRKHRIETAHRLTPGARLILLADKLYNSRDALEFRPVGWDDMDVREYLQWVADVVREIRGSNEPLEKLLSETLAKGGVQL